MTRELPNSQRIEQSLLGSVMIYPTVIKECLEMDLREDEFYLPGHQKIYQAMVEISNAEQIIDVNTLITKLNDKNELDITGGADYIIGLADSAISSANTKNYVETIKNKAQLRQLIYTADRIGQNAYESSEDIDILLDDAERSIMDVTRHRRGEEFESSETIVSRVIEEINSLKNHKGVTGIATGFTALDKMTNGFGKGDLIILAARPAMGKSAFALNLLNEVAKRNEGAAAMFSLEMPSDQLMKRLLSCEAQVISNKLKDGKLNSEDMSKLHSAGTRLSERKIFIDDTSSIKVSQIFSKCRKLKNEYGSISIIVIDYLQLITGTRADSRQQEVSDISRNLKILAKELECPVIALSQLSRKVEERQDHKPMLSDLRESGSIEQDADIVMFLYREKYYDKENQNQDEAEIIDIDLAKHRNGSVGGLQLSFDKRISRFTNLAAQGDSVNAN